MEHRRLTLLVTSLASALVASAIVIAPAGASNASNGHTRHIAPSGKTHFSPTPSGSATGVQSPELAPGSAGADAAGGSGNGNGVNRSRSIAHGAPAVDPVTVTDGQGVSSSGPLTVLSTFDGLNHRQQRTANGGNQFSLEPPDQGLCVGNGAVMEIINDVMQVYIGGAPQGVEDLNTFFGYSPAIVRGTPNPFGAFITDPSCYYDKNTNRWFADVLTIDTFSDSGNFKGTNHLDLAVSDTGNPTGTWTVYRTPVQDDGTQGTPDHGCTGIPPYGQSTTPTNPNACLGDYPHLGADANGVYLTTNEYSFFGNDFHGAQIYAFSKTALTAASPSANVTQFDTHGLDNHNSGFTIWPATAPAGLNSSDNGGTEYFMSSNAADEAHGNGVAVGPRRSNQLLVWSLTDTSALDTTPASVNLSHVTLGVGLYVVPARSEQKVGSTPLIDCLNNKSCATNFLLGAPDPFAPEHEYNIDSNDTRMQQVVFANGMLWGALDTGVKSSANTRAGVEWFVVNPTAAGGPTLVNQGYLAVKQNNAIYPAIAVTPNGNGVVAFTLVGRDFYPSAAFASINANGVGAVQVAAQGLGPADGFSGTAVFNAPNPARPRWGDYGAAVVDGSNIWIASEYIGQTCTLSQYIATGASCGGTRTLLANWDTRLTEVATAG
jgi:hypothetical protein